jgi:hypothetical protein
MEKQNYTAYGMDGVIAAADTMDEFIEQMHSAGHELRGFFQRVSMRQNEKLDGQPKFNGILGPMLDGGRVRYETEKLYDRLSM